VLLSKASEKMVAQFNPGKPHYSKCGATPNAPCQVPKPPSRIRPNRQTVFLPYLGLLQPHKPKPANRISRIRPNRGLAEYLLGVIRAFYFMNTITKEQIQQFTPEQQAAVATMALRRVQKRERLLKQARQSRRSIFATAAMLALAYGMAVFLKAPPLLQLGVFVLAMAIMMQSIAVNRRLDALLELFDDDHDA
jgi:hypothetical protein